MCAATDPENSCIRINEVILGGPLGFWQMTSWAETTRQLGQTITDWRREGLAEASDFVATGIAAEHYAANTAVRAYYREAAYSFVMVGAVSTLVETLCFRAGRRFFETCKGAAPTTCIRWTSLPGDRWDKRTAEQERWEPRWYCNARAEWTENFERGVVQLVDSLGVGTTISDEDKAFIEGIRRFRNRALHWGYEWPEAYYRKFAKSARDGKWDKWFRFATTEDQLPLFRVDAIDSVMDRVDSIARTLWRCEERLFKKTEQR